MKQASITLITALQLPTRPAPINTGFQPGAANPRQNPNRFPTVSRSTQGIQINQAMAPSHPGFLRPVVPIGKRGAYSLRTAHIQPLNRSRTGVVQVKTGLIQVNTAKYSPTPKNGPWRAKQQGQPGQNRTARPQETSKPAKIESVTYGRSR
jgi:hypothetical protein